MRTPRTFLLGPLTAQADSNAKIETVKHKIAEALEPLDQEGRQRVIARTVERLKKDEAEATERVLERAREAQPLAPLPPARRLVVQQVSELLAQDHLSPEDLKAALSLLTAEEEDRFLAEYVRGSQALGEDARKQALENLATIQIGKSRADRALAAFDEAMAEHPDKRKMLEAKRAKLTDSIDRLDEVLKAETNIFLIFCQALRGYEIGPEPGAALMAMGRLFVGEEDTEAKELAELLTAIEKAAELIGWEHFAPNARACFEYLRERCDGEQGALELLFARRWAKVGFPVFEMGHRTAASLMFTHGSGAVESPWPAFMVKVPDGLVTLEDGSVRYATLARVLVLAPSEKLPHWELLQFWRRLSDQKGTVLRVPMKTLDGELTEPVDWSVFASQEAGLPRAIEMIGRLVAGSCMLATAKQDIEERSWSPKTKSERRRTPGVEPPVGTRFIVTKNVALDLREQVHEYIAGRTRKGGKLTVQFVVRGHRRWQACGPRHTERKLIWINPFWKGDPEAIAIVRGYELRGPQEEREQT